MPSVLIKSNKINQMGWFNLADFQRARAFQARDHAKAIANSQMGIPTCAEI